MTRLSTYTIGRTVGAMRAHFGRTERGITAAIFAVALVVLLGMVAVGIDGGRIFDERRRAQTAADHAAMAAALASCTGGDAVAVGKASAAANGYDDNGTSNNVEITPVVGGTDEYLARVDTTIGSTFAQVIGFATLATNGEARASATGCEGSSGPGVLYAGGDDCIKDVNSKYGIDATGSTLKVYGGVRSNSDTNVGGSGNEWRLAGAPVDVFEFVGEMYPNTSPAGNVFDTGQPNDIGPGVPPPQWPAGWEPSVANPSAANEAYWDTWEARATADGHAGLVNTQITSLTTNGVYYTEHVDGMDISSISVGVTEITLVARQGPIRFSGGVDNRTFSPDPDGKNIIVMSGMVKPNADKKCSESTVEISGSNTEWNGILWAPGGQVRLNGSNSANALDGTVIGWSIQINGSNITLKFDPDLFPGDPDILLLE